MTTAHRPTWHPAVGAANGGYYSFPVERMQKAVRDMPSETRLKTRQVGQNRAEDVAQRDLKRELEDRERKHQETIQQAKRREGLLEDNVLSENAAPVDAKLLLADPELAQFDDADDEDSQSGSDASEDDDDSDDSDDEEAELMRQLARIKEERAAQERAEADQAALAEAQERHEAVMSSNPIMDLRDAAAAVDLAPSGAAAAGARPSSFNVKRRWNDDVVFRHQARDEPKRKKRYINDTIRSDFHRKFMSRYVQ